MEKAELEEKKLYMTLCQTKQKPHQEGKAPKPKGESPPPAPVLLSRTDHTFTFAPAPYDLGEQVKSQVFQTSNKPGVHMISALPAVIQVCWYQLFGRVAEGINKTVRLNDCILPGTGLMVKTTTLKSHVITSFCNTERALRFWWVLEGA